MRRAPMAPELRQATGAERSKEAELEIAEAAVWRYPEMCSHWGVSRATVERWVRRFERTGEGIPVHRDPSGRPYWLPAEASADAQPVNYSPSVAAGSHNDRLAALRQAATRGRRVS